MLAFFKAESSIAISERLSIVLIRLSVKSRILVPKLLNFRETNLEKIIRITKTGRLSNKRFNPNILKRIKIPPIENINSATIEKIGISKLIAARFDELISFSLNILISFSL